MRVCEGRELGWDEGMWFGNGLLFSFSLPLGGANRDTVPRAVDPSHIAAQTHTHTTPRFPRNSCQIQLATDVVTNGVN